VRHFSKPLDYGRKNNEQDRYTEDVMNKLLFIIKLANKLNASGLSVNELATLATLYTLADGAKSITTDELKKTLGVRSIAPTLKVLGSLIQRVSPAKTSPYYHQVKLTLAGERALSLIIDVA